MAGIAGRVKKDKLSRKSDRIKERADQETLNAVRNEPCLLKADIAPFASPQLEENEEHHDSENLINEALRKHRLVRPYEEHLCRMNNETDNENDH